MFNNVYAIDFKMKIIKSIYIIISLFFVGCCCCMSTDAYNEWYFTQGFEKNIRKKKVNTQLADSSYASSNAIRLTRYNEQKQLISYWVDIDRIELAEKKIRLKIIDSLGYVHRFIEERIAVGEKDTILPNFNEGKLIEKKNGSIAFSVQDKEFIIINYSEIDQHYLDVIIPNKLKDKHPSFQEYWSKNAQKYWVTYEGQREQFHMLYKYSYEGNLLDSCFVKISPNIKKVNNYFIDFKRYDDKFFYNDGIKHTMELIPYAGYGDDQSFIYIHPFLHTFEKEGLFQNYIDRIWHGSPLKDVDFLRDSSTLKIVHETIKNIGYDQFLSKESFVEKSYRFDDKCLSWKRKNDSINYSLQDINDTLIYSYHLSSQKDDYYQDFWNRRKKEGTDEMVFEILCDLQKYYQDKDVAVQNKFVNDTLQNMLQYDLQYQQADSTKKGSVLVELYDYLNQIGLKHSAYNLIFLNSATEHIGLDREKIWEALNVTRPVYHLEDKKYFLNTNQPQWIQYERYSEYYY